MKRPASHVEYFVFSYLPKEPVVRVLEGWYDAKTNTSKGTGWSSYVVFPRPSR